MANYDTLKNTLQSNVYQNSNNAVTGAILQNVLMSFINTMGTGSNFMGFLSAANKPTGTVDGKQFYIGYNASTTALSIDLSAVGLGTLSITRSKLYIVHNIGGTWAAVDIAAGLADSVTPNNGMLTIIASSVEQNPLGTFSANQAGNQTIDIPVFDAKIVLVREDDPTQEIGSFTVNAKEDKIIAIPTGGGGGGSSTLGGLSDVVYVGNLALGQVLKYNGTAWVNATDVSLTGVKLGNTSAPVSNNVADIATLVGAGIITLKDSNNTTLGSFSVNQISNQTIIIPVGSGGGGVSSVGMSVPTGFSVSGSPITSYGTFALKFADGYSLPKTNKQSNWDTAYNERHTHSNISVLNGITNTKVSNWDSAVTRNYYKDGSEPSGCSLDGNCKILKLESNAVYYCSNVVSLGIIDYDYVDSNFDSLIHKETYIIVDAASNINVDVSGLNVYHEKDGSLGLGNITGGSTFLITVQGIIFDVRKLS